MKRLLGLLALGLALIGAPALAANCSTYPYVLTNGQTADANQVMANFNSILSCANTNLLPSPLTNSQVITGLGYTPLDIAGTNAMTGRLTLVTGTNSLTPLVIPVGVLNTTPVSGAVENDGTNFYGVNSSAARKALAYADGSNFVTAYAPLASPTFTGTPAAPTASLGTNTTQIATTAFVIANAGAKVPSGSPTGGSNITASGSNSGMFLNISGSQTTYTVTFGGTWTAAPKCIFNPADNATATGGVVYFLTTSTTVLTVHASTVSSAGGLNVICGL